MNDTNTKPSGEQLIFLKNAGRLPRSIVYDTGFKILGTPLAFNGARNPGLLFFSDLNMKIRSGIKHVIGSDVAIATLGSRRKRIDAIAVSFDRQFKLGKMTLRLLPSGMGPGAAMLEITFNEKKILYTSGCRTAAALAGASVHRGQWDIMVIDFKASATRPPAPKTMKSQLRDWCQGHLNPSGTAAPVVLYDSATALVDVVASLADMDVPLVAHRSAYSLLRDSAIGQRARLPVKRLGSRWPDAGVVIYPRGAFIQSDYGMDIRIQGCASGDRETLPTHIESYRAGEPEHIGGLVKFASDCGVKTVCISPHGGEKCAAAFQKAGFNVYFSRIPTQLKLPL